MMDSVCVCGGGRGWGQEQGGQQSTLNVCVCVCVCACVRVSVRVHTPCQLLCQPESKVQLGNSNTNFDLLPPTNGIQHPLPIQHDPGNYCKKGISSLHEMEMVAVSKICWWGNSDSGIPQHVFAFSSTTAHTDEDRANGIRQSMPCLKYIIAERISLRHHNPVHCWVVIIIITFCFRLPVINFWLPLIITFCFRLLVI